MSKELQVAMDDNRSVHETQDDDARFSAANSSICNPSSGRLSLPLPVAFSCGKNPCSLRESWLPSTRALESQCQSIGFCGIGPLLRCASKERRGRHDLCSLAIFLNACPWRRVESQCPGSAPKRDRDKQALPLIRVLRRAGNAVESETVRKMKDKHPYGEHRSKSDHAPELKGFEEDA